MIISSDTICAISTPVGSGGICIIRISGDNAFKITSEIFKRPCNEDFELQQAGTIRYGHIIDKDNEVVDEVLVSKMKSPHTYTTEDVVEINCHGGMSAARSVLNVVLSKGARLAEAGEFTKRAFLNGRIDLTQAEAITEIINAKTEKSAKASVLRLKGNLSDTINTIKAEILAFLANLEVTIQYPEYDIDEVTDAELVVFLDDMHSRLNKLLSTYKKGEILNSGLKVAIAGKPNVGKSMLLNSLLNKNKAIVTEIAGTTRDVVDEYINLNGIPVIIMDTAGIRNSDDIVESIGINKSLDAIEDADLVLFVVDGSKELDDEDNQIYAKIKDKDHLIILNKSDLSLNEQTVSKFNIDEYISISAMNKVNILEIEKRISNYVENENADSINEAMLSNERQRLLIEDAISSIENAKAIFESAMPVDLVEIDIKQCWEILGKITGESAGEDIVDEIFKNFCLGK